MKNSLIDLYTPMFVLYNISSIYYSYPALNPLMGVKCLHSINNSTNRIELNRLQIGY